MVEPTTGAVALAVAELSKMIKELATLIWNPSVQKLRKEVKILKNKSEACYLAGEYIFMNDEVRDSLQDCMNGQVLTSDRIKELEKIIKKQGKLYDDFRKLSKL